MSGRQMEAELRCPLCNKFYADPVLLPCSHSVCYTCALSLVQLVPGDCVRRTQEDETNSVRSATTGRPKLSSSVSTSGLSSLQQFNQRDRRSSLGCGSLGRSSFPDSMDCCCDCELSDRASLVSETDSGVVCGGTPSGACCRAPSFGALTHGCHNAEQLLTCPACRCTIPLVGNGVESLSHNIALASIVNRYNGPATASARRDLPSECQLCEGAKSFVEVICVQCNIAYCTKCRESCHPLRGPLSQHRLVSPLEMSQLRSGPPVTQKCLEHRDEVLSVYCNTCCSALCCVCIQSGQHANHSVQAVSTLCKMQKLELSKQLHRLSETARRGSEFLQELKHLQNDIQPSCVEFEASLVAQFDAIIDALHFKQQQLLDQVSLEKQHKVDVFREQIGSGSTLVQRTTGLLQLSIEMLKETDPLSFLQVASGLINRVSVAEESFRETLTFEPKVSSEFELRLNCDRVLDAVRCMNLHHCKVPTAPHIIAEECCSEQNTVTVSWRAADQSVSVDGYVLELAENDSSQFREVYSGPETLCTVEGLNFNTTYVARVRGFNQAGDGAFSSFVYLDTAEVSTFTFDTASVHTDALLSNNKLTATCGAQCGTTDNRVVMATVGFTAGIHYWEFIINRIDGNSDSAFGVALLDVAKDRMLGKDSKAWSMYIDHSRSWYLHAGAHSCRQDGGISVGSVVGVLLDLRSDGTLSFFINGKPRGGATTIAFSGLHGGIFFPAVSVNRSTTVTLCSGKRPPVLNGSFSDND